MANTKEIRKIDGLHVTEWSERNGDITTEQSAMVRRRHAEIAIAEQLELEQEEERLP